MVVDLVYRVSKVWSKALLRRLTSFIRAILLLHKADTALSEVTVVCRGIGTPLFGVFLCLEPVDMFDR